MKKIEVCRKNISIFEDMTNDLKKYAFILKLLLDALCDSQYSKNENEIYALLFDYSDIIDNYVFDMETLLECMLNKIEMNKAN